MIRVQPRPPAVTKSFRHSDFDIRHSLTGIKICQSMVPSAIILPWKSLNCFDFQLDPPALIGHTEEVWGISFGIEEFALPPDPA